MSRFNVIIAQFLVTIACEHVTLTIFSSKKQDQTLNSLKSIASRQEIYTDNASCATVSMSIFK